MCKEDLPIVNSLSHEGRHYPGYREHDLTYIPEECPYCYGKITRISLGINPSTGKVFNDNICKPCEVYFGISD